MIHSLVTVGSKFGLGILDSWGRLSLLWPPEPLPKRFEATSCEWELGVLDFA